MPATTAKGRLFIIGMNRDHIVGWCKKNGVQPYSREIVMLSGGNGCRGTRLSREDQVIVLSDAIKRKDWDELRAAMLPTGVDIEKVPMLNG